MAFCDSTGRACRRHCCAEPWGCPRSACTTSMSAIFHTRLCWVVRWTTNSASSAVMIFNEQGGGHCRSSQWSERASHSMPALKTDSRPTARSCQTLRTNQSKAKQITAKHIKAMQSKAAPSKTNLGEACTMCDPDCNKQWPWSAK